MRPVRRAQFSDHTPSCLGRSHPAPSRVNPGKEVSATLITRFESILPPNVSGAERISFSRARVKGGWVARVGMGCPISTGGTMSTWIANRVRQRATKDDKVRH